MSFYSLNPDSCPIPDPFLSNNNFNPELANPECDLPGLYHFQAEILRTGWILGSVISYNLRDSIGNAFLNNAWQDHPFFGSLQNSFNQLSRKSTQLVSCSSEPIFVAAQKGLLSLRHSLKKEEVPSNLSDLLALNSDSLGVFSDTPLIVSDKGPSLPNVITQKEFEHLQEVYTAIEKGKGSLTIDSALLVELRIILSTKIGRDLIYALYKQAKPLSIEQGDSSIYSSTKAKVIISEELRKRSMFFFGAPGSDKVKISGIKYATLFHELTHAYHDLVTGDWALYKFKNRDTYYDVNPWTNQEEERTILKTNEFQRQLKLGEEDWYGRWSHFGTRVTENLDLENLFRYKVRLHDQTKTSNTTQELYEDHPIIDGLLTVCPNINHHLIDASSLNNLDWLYTILNSTRALEIPAKDLGRALKAASSHGHKDMIETLLNSKIALKISSQALAQAFETACYRGDKDVLETILNSKIALNISSQALAQTLKGISSHGYKDELETILNSKIALKISSQALAQTLKTASLYGHKDVVETILNSKLALEMSSESLGHAFKEASSIGYKDVVETFLNSKIALKIPSQALTQALEEASSIGYKDIVKTILNSKRALEISSEALESALPLISTNEKIVQKIFDKLSWTKKVQYRLGLIHVQALSRELFGY